MSATRPDCASSPRQHFDGANNHATEFDDDGDGTFERRVEYDRYGEPKLR